jgi:putative aminopeptidase FrvX
MTTAAARRGKRKLRPVAANPGPGAGNGACNDARSGSCNGSHPGASVGSRTSARGSLGAFAGARVRPVAAASAGARRAGLLPTLCCTLAVAAGLPLAGPGLAIGQPAVAQALPGGPPGSSRAGEARGRAAHGLGAARNTAELGGQLEAFLGVAAVGGRGEQAAAAFLRDRLGGELPVRTDELGDLTVTFGSGQPRRLIACPLGEPGLVVSRIEDRGYLRLAAAGGAGTAGALPAGAYEGQLVRVTTARGAVPGVVAARSIHLQPRTDQAAPPFSLADAFVDVGAESVGEAAEMGIRPLDPVALEPRPARLAHDLVAGPGARQKAACIAAADAAGRFRIAPGKGTVVFAWTASSLAGHGGGQRTGLEHLLRERGPFTELVLLGSGISRERQNSGARTTPAASPAAPPPLSPASAPPASTAPVPSPAPGTGPLAAGALAPRFPGTRAAPDLAPPLRPDEAALWPAAVGYLGLPALYPGTAVETVSLADLRQLSSTLLAFLGSAPPKQPSQVLSPLPRGDASGSAASTASPSRPSSAAVPGSSAPAARSSPASRQSSPPPGAGPAATISLAAAAAAPPPPSVAPGAGPLHADTAALVAALVSRHGVSGDETAVRQAIAARLPAWAHPAVDWVGNLSVTAGPAADADPRLFMAHMDEIGFRVARVLDDGRLDLEARGGLLPALWQAQAALVHGSHGPVPALFEPRAPLSGAGSRPTAGGDLTAFLGARDPREVAALGIPTGTTVTMPKALLRLGSHRVTARGLDDRAGAAVLLLALRRLDPARLRHRVTFAWTTREETGLLGAAVLAHRREGWRRIYPIDAFPTSDSPRESGGHAYAPLGRGAVLPATAPSALRDRLLDLARRRGIALQLGMASGANDGIPFQRDAATVLPIFFPCRYTHTPVEVADLRDLEALADLVAALASAAP